MKKTFQFPDKLNITLTCASGVEKVLKSELKRLGYEDAPVVNGALSLNGSPTDVAKLNVFLRTADRVYVTVGGFNVLDFDSLFEGVKAIRWEDYLPENARVTVNGKCVKSQLFAVSACQSLIKKAIVDRLCNKYGLNRLYETGAEYHVEFSIFKDYLTLNLNTSGAGLHKRGYRDMVGIAPIKETLASALILLSDFYNERPFADPFCGSGTIAIEGAKIALDIAGGISRRFAFNDWVNFDQKIYDRVREEALDREKRNRIIDFVASDVDPKAVSLAKRHAERAGLKDKIRFEVCDVKNFKSSLSNGTIVTNPPYGERVYDRKEAEECYKSLGKAFKSLDNWSLFAITSALNFEKHFGKKCDRQRKLYNSNKECRFYYYYKERIKKETEYDS